MSVSARRQWQHFKALPSGRRFETRYRLRRARSGGIAGRMFFSAVGLLVMLVGAAMLVLPGPGLLVLVLGAAIVAQQSLFVARSADWIDLRISRSYRRWRARRAR